MGNNDNYIHLSTKLIIFIIATQSKIKLFIKLTHNFITKTCLLAYNINARDLEYAKV